MMPNPLNSLPVPVYPIDRDRADYAVSRNRLGDYFLRNPAAYRKACDARHTAAVVRIAAHACGLWFARWQNPDSGRIVIVVASKDVMPLLSVFERTLAGKSVQDALKRRS